MSEESLKYIPFARKYRSTNFSELLGQEVLVKTLSYAIANNRLAK
jgi:DNA polymerase III subunit gamma/tau